MSKHKEPTAKKSRGRGRVPGPSRASTPVPIPAQGGGSRHIQADPFRSPLARVLDTPHLAGLVPHLPPETLHALIRHSGLHACAELVAAATPQQLTSVFDLDLWRPARPGQNEQFDADRFGEWLEVLVDTDATVAARIVAAQDEHLVVAGLSRYIRVFDPSAIALPTWTEDDEPVDSDLTSHQGVERQLGGYLVRAIRSDAWDAIVALLLALDADHQDRFHAVMRECRRLSNSTPEVDGLDDLLTAPEQMLHDAAVDRGDRQAQQGYSTPADARAFLQLARQRKRRPRGGAPPTNPIAAAYFRAATAASADPDAAAVPSRELLPSSTGGSVPAGLDAFVDLLAEAGLVPQRPRALLEGRSEQSRLALIRRLMEHLRDRDAEAYFSRSRELAFLANTLIAGCAVQSRSFTAQEASDAVVSTCNLGLEHWPARWHAGSGVAASPDLPDAFLVDHDLVTAFETGWEVLHCEVSLFVADHLATTLKSLRHVDAETQRELVVLRRELVKQRAAGTPWRAREALEVLAMLDTTAWVSLVGLLDECPMLPEALTATLEGRTGAVSPTAFDFISTTAQIDAVRVFMATLVDVLSG